MDYNNILGLDKFQLSIIKGNFNSTKPIRKMIDKATVKAVSLQQKEEEEHKAVIAKYKDKLASANQEIDAYKKQIELLDTFALETTKKTCGFALTTEQVIDFLDNPYKFDEYKQSLGMGNDLFEGQENLSPDETDNSYQVKGDSLNEDEARNMDEEEDKEWEDRIASGELKEVTYDENMGEGHDIEQE